LNRGKVEVQNVSIFHIDTFQLQRAKFGTAVFNLGFRFHKHKSKRQDFDAACTLISERVFGEAVTITQLAKCCKSWHYNQKDTQKL